MIESSGVLCVNMIVHKCFLVFLSLNPDRMKNHPIPSSSGRCQDPLTPAEMAVLQFWHEYVRRYSPGACRYVPDVHCIHRTKLFYLMTEDLIEHYKTSGVPRYSSRAGQLMGVSVGSLKNWRDIWGKLWRRLRLK